MDAGRLALTFCLKMPKGLDKVRDQMFEGGYNNKKKNHFMRGMKRLFLMQWICWLK